ncbi:hypothetical protein TYRP_014760 [Tyrophagus putrescentiae]|nr:hypothetical protein TYRP_014760 [Tyrophagus putrescentiae]
MVLNGAHVADRLAGDEEVQPVEAVAANVRRVLQQQQHLRQRRRRLVGRRLPARRHSTDHLRVVRITRVHHHRAGHVDGEQQAAGLANEEGHRADAPADGCAASATSIAAVHRFDAAIIFLLHAFLFLLVPVTVPISIPVFFLLFLRIRTAVDEALLVAVARNQLLDDGRRQHPRLGHLHLAAVGVVSDQHREVLGRLLARLLSLLPLVLFRSLLIGDVLLEEALSLNLPLDVGVDGRLLPGHVAHRLLHLGVVPGKALQLDDQLYEAEELAAVAAAAAPAADLGSGGSGSCEMYSFGSGVPWMKRSRSSLSSRAMAAISDGGGLGLPAFAAIIIHSRDEEAHQPQVIPPDAANVLVEAAAHKAVRHVTGDLADGGPVQAAHDDGLRWWGGGGGGGRGRRRETVLLLQIRRLPPLQLLVGQLSPLPEEDDVFAAGQREDRLHQRRGQLHGGQGKAQQSGVQEDVHRGEHVPVGGHHRLRLLGGQPGRRLGQRQAGKVVEEEELRLRLMVRKGGAALPENLPQRLDEDVGTVGGTAGQGDPAHNQLLAGLANLRGQEEPIGPLLRFGKVRLGVEEVWLGGGGGRGLLGLLIVLPGGGVCGPRAIADAVRLTEAGDHLPQDCNLAVADCQSPAVAAAAHVKVVVVVAEVLQRRAAPAEVFGFDRSKGIEEDGGGGNRRSPPPPPVLPTLLGYPQRAVPKSRHHSVRKAT